VRWVLSDDVTGQTRDNVRESAGVRVHPIVVVAALVLVAVNLRTTVASVPPVLGHIERDLRLSGPAAGLLTALPVMCMAWFAPTAHRLAHRFGREASTFGAIALVAAGNGVRLGGGNALALYGGTLAAGVGVAIIGVVLPGLIKHTFPRQVGPMTGAYSVAMMLGGTVAAAVAVPLERLLGSWQESLASWSVPAVLAAAVWLLVARRVDQPEFNDETSPGGLPWRSRTAWLLVGFFSLQASIGYAFLAWLAPAYVARGWSAAAAGALLAVNSLAQLGAALVMPVLASRLSDPRPAVVSAVAATTLGCAWLLVMPDVLPWAAVAVAGIGLGGGFSLALVLLADFAAHPLAAGRLAAFVFLVGYTVAAIAPVLIGAMRDVTGGFTAAFGLLTAMAIAQLWLGRQLGPERRASIH
jgi:CP family cyanate transporter-like MFS transporter